VADLSLRARVVYRLVRRHVNRKRIPTGAPIHPITTSSRARSFQRGRRGELGRLTSAPAVRTLALHSAHEDETSTEPRRHAADGVDDAERRGRAHAFARSRERSGCRTSGHDEALGPAAEHTWRAIAGGKSTAPADPDQLAHATAGSPRHHHAFRSALRASSRRSAGRRPTRVSAHDPRHGRSAAHIHPAGSEAIPRDDADVLPGMRRKLQRAERGTHATADLWPHEPERMDGRDAVDGVQRSRRTAARDVVSRGRTPR